jgi:hypothetical protein
LSLFSPLICPSSSWINWFLYNQLFICVRLIYHPDDWGCMNFWNVGLLQWDYMALYPWRL